MQQTIAEVFGLKQPAAYKSKQNPDKTSNDSLLCGLELEVEHLPGGLAHYADQCGNFWSVVEDGSLRPRGEAWEFVSRPALLGVALAELRLLVQKMKWTNYNYSDRCSVHVHTNVLDFTQQQVANLALVYPVFEAVLFRFVNHYKKQEEQGYCRDTNLYCIPWADCRMNRNFIEKFFTNPSLFVPERRGLGTRSWEKYTALNFKPISEHGTVEWRHMHGTADMEKLTMWLNIIGSIMRFCKDQAFDDIIKTIKVLNDVSTYQQFFQSVLGNVLEYKEEYRAPMAEGVVNAKYSLINWEANKGKERIPVKKPGLRPQDGDFDWDVHLEDMGAPIEQVVQLAGDPNVGPHVVGNPVNLPLGGWGRPAPELQAEAAAQQRDQADVFARVLGDTRARMAELQAAQAVAAEQQIRRAAIRPDTARWGDIVRVQRPAPIIPVPGNTNRRNPR